MNKIDEIKAEIDQQRSDHRKFIARKEEEITAIENLHTITIGELRAISNENWTGTIFDLITEALRQARPKGPLPTLNIKQLGEVAMAEAMKHTGGNRKRASELLGIGERTVYRRTSEPKTKYKENDVKMRLNAFVVVHRKEINEKSKELHLAHRNKDTRKLNLVNNAELRAWAVEKGLEL